MARDLNGQKRDRYTIGRWLCRVKGCFGGSPLACVLYLSAGNSGEKDVSVFVRGNKPRPAGMNRDGGHFALERTAEVGMIQTDVRAVLPYEHVKLVGSGCDNAAVPRYAEQTNSF